MASVTIDAGTVPQLVAQARQGNRVAADRLIREHQGWVRSALYAVTGRSDVLDDLAQQVWTRAWQRLDSLENPERLRPWLYAIARHTALDFSLARKREQSQTATLAERAAPPAHRAASPERAASNRELHDVITRAVQALPALYREPFVLRHLEDWSYAEIAAVLELTPAAVETRLVRARQLLRETLQGKVEP